MSDSDVIRVGTDSGGRDLWMTVYMSRWWGGVVRHLGWEPTIVQGAFMARNGGGAQDSEGFHDGGGCLDLRTWDRSSEQIGQMIRVIRLGGAAAWYRTPGQGFDEHIHLVLGADYHITNNALLQWRNYLAGDAGLDGSQPDYHWRPDPLVLEPPDDYMEDPVDEVQEDRIARKAAKEVLGSSLVINKGKKNERSLSIEQAFREILQRAAKDDPDDNPSND